MSKEKRRVPKLRFPGFTEDWEQRKFKDIAFKRGKISEADLPYVEFEDINSGIGTLNKNISQKVGHKKGLLFEAGDVLFGKLRPYLQNWLLCQFAGIAVGDFWVLQPQNVSSAFLYYLIQSEAYQSVANISSGTKMPRSSWPLVSETLFSIPKYKEANMIGEFFLLIDRTITLHQRKLNNLKLKKKALLQKLFPKNGERYPELRFSGFTDAWEQCKLGEIFEYLQNNTLSRDSLNYRIPNIKNIHYGDILVKFNEILDGSNKDIPYINPDLDLSKFSKSLLRDGDVIFSDTAEDDTVGKVIELQNVNAPFILSGLHTIPCRPLIPFGKGYLGNFFNSNSYRLQIRPLVQGIKVSSISKSALKDTMIKYPKNLDEQEKIGSLFQSITKMITLHQ